MKFLVVFLLSGLATIQAHAQGTVADYQRAEKFLDLHTLVEGGTVAPGWFGDGSRFWYRSQRNGAVRFVIVDPRTNKVIDAFDHKRLAEGLARATGTTVDAARLPFSEIDLSPGGDSVRVAVAGKGWRCELATYACASAVLPATKLETVSPNGRWAISVRADNLWLRDLETGEARALSRDGVPNRGYASPDTGNPISARMIDGGTKPRVFFSPDSTKVAAFRTDQRKVTELGVMEARSGAAPVLHRYRMPIAGDADMPIGEAVVFDLATGVSVAAQMPEYLRGPDYAMQRCWSADSARFCFMHEERGLRSVTLTSVDARTGSTTKILTETADKSLPRGLEAHFVDGDRQILWISERDGWRHIYAYGADGKGIGRQVTRGDWNVMHIIPNKAADARYIYFVGQGREQGIDPYLRQLYRIRLDGTGLERLTPEDAYHTVTFSPDGEYFIDTHSTSAQPHRSVLRRNNGALVRELEVADISRLTAAGWKAPIPFKVTAADSATPIYGNLFLPTNYDPTKTYPVLDSVYPGPQRGQARKLFDADRFQDEYALAELGFIVVNIDGRGTPGRSRAFRELSYGNLGNPGFLNDHVAGLRQLAERYPAMDLTRVGIYGHSGGGSATLMGLLRYPEFYKVGVSSAPQTDVRGYYAFWGERFEGWPVTSAFDEQAAATYAPNLTGKLLLIHGSMDDNVPLTSMLEAADALIRANKQFDMFVMPNRNHPMRDLGALDRPWRGYDPYFERLRWDYFVRHLMGVEPPSTTATEKRP